MAVMLPKRKGLRRESNVTGQLTTTYGTTIQSHSVAHQYPATYTQLIASTSFDTDWVEIFFHTNSTTNTDTDSLVTIYVGAGAAEQILIPSLMAGFAALPITNGRVTSYAFPLYIPAGSRISARHQSVRTSTNVTCIIALYGSDRSSHWTGTKVEAIGVATATSSGTYVTPGTASEGTLTRLGASDGAATLAQEWGFVQPVAYGNLDATVTAAAWNALDLGTSAAVISGLEDWWYFIGTDETANAMGTAGRYCYVPAGTILYARIQGSGGTTEGQSVIAYGVF